MDQPFRNSDFRMRAHVPRPLAPLGAICEGIGRHPAVSSICEACPKRKCKAYLRELLLVDFDELFDFERLAVVGGRRWVSGWWLVCGVGGLQISDGVEQV